MYVENFKNHVDFPMHLYHAIYLKHAYYFIVLCHCVVQSYIFTKIIGKYVSSSF